MVRIALVGCGTMGRTHSNGYKTIGNAQPVAFCDLHAGKAQALAAAHGAAAYTDFHTMLGEADFDVLDVCLPTYLHRDYAVAGMRAGKHVFCEKPLARSEEEALDMLAAAKTYGVKFSVGHVLRFFPNYAHAAGLAAAGRLGTPRLIRTVRNQAFPAWSWEGWYQDYEKSGGPILDLVIHDLDWIMHSFGAVQRVYAMSLNGKVPGQEHCLLVLRLQNGAIAHVEGSWALPNGAAFHMAYEVVGTKAQVEYDSLKDAPVVLETAPEGVHQVAYHSPMLGDMEPYTSELQKFIDCVERDTEPAVTGEEALNVLRVALAALKSSQTGRPVTL